MDGSTVKAEGIGRLDIRGEGKARRRLVMMVVVKAKAGFSHNRLG